MVSASPEVEFAFAVISIPVNKSPKSIGLEINCSQRAEFGAVNWPGIGWHLDTVCHCSHTTLLLPRSTGHPLHSDLESLLTGQSQAPAAATLQLERDDQKSNDRSVICLPRHDSDHRSNISTGYQATRSWRNPASESCH